MPLTMRYRLAIALLGADGYGWNGEDTEAALAATPRGAIYLRKADYVMNELQELRETKSTWTDQEESTT